MNKLDPAGLMTTTAEEWARCAVAFHDGPWLWVCGGIGTNGGPGSAGYVPRQPTAESDRGGAGPGRSIIEEAQVALKKVQSALHDAAATQGVFTGEHLDCISGIETGRTWSVNVAAANGRVGLFQLDETNWKASGTSIQWANGQAAKDPARAAAVALALLYRKLGYDGVSKPTEEAITRAIDNFGEGDSRYGRTVTDCANALKYGNFSQAYRILYDYADWVRRGRP